MTSKTDFTDEEWARLVRSPLVAGMAISLADPGGPIETLKETMATAKPIVETARKGGGENELIDALAKDLAAKAQQRENPIKDFRPKGTMAGAEILEELRAANSLVTEKATPEEAQAFREWLIAAAQRAAEAAKEGGFMGFGAEQVSEGEQRMLERVREAMSA
jgi:ABC-type Fe3+ transport system substrate-binding protein